jgi:hypothetical protein
MQKIFPFLIFLLASCKEAMVPKAQISFKDSLIGEFLTHIDSLDFYDTTNYNFKVLKAYYKNDTAFFRQMQKDIEYERKYSSENSYFDSCVTLKKLSDLNVDEVYRFRHSESFCSYSQFVTISRKGKSIFLHYLEISSSPDGQVIEYRDKDGAKRIGPGCKVEKEFSKCLKDKDWEILMNNVANADYWLLKERQYHGCCDGSFWTIDGYTKRLMYYTGQQIHSVYRWTPNNSFAELGRVFMKLAGEKTMCRDFF